MNRNRRSFIRLDDDNSRVEIAEVNSPVTTEVCSITSKDVHESARSATLCHQLSFVYLSDVENPQTEELICDVEQVVSEIYFTRVEKPIEVRTEL